MALTPQPPRHGTPVGEGVYFDIFWTFVGTCLCLFWNFSGHFRLFFDIFVFLSRFFQNMCNFWFFFDLFGEILRFFWTFCQLFWDIFRTFWVLFSNFFGIFLRHFSNFFGLFLTFFGIVLGFFWGIFRTFFPTFLNQKNRHFRTFEAFWVRFSDFWCFLGVFSIIFGFWGGDFDFVCHFVDIPAHTICIINVFFGGFSGNLFVGCVREKLISSQQWLRCFPE